MRISRTNILTGKDNIMDLDITPDQLTRWIKNGELIQNVMPDLTPTEREFLITGMSPDEQDAFTRSMEE